MCIRDRIISAGRRLNDGMGKYVAGQLIKKMLRRGLQVCGAKILVMGLTFKENCPDLRNTRVIDVISELREYGVEIDVYDPWASAKQAAKEYNICLVNSRVAGTYSGILLAVAHDQFVELGSEGVRRFGIPDHVLYDIKYVLEPNASDLRL